MPASTKTENFFLNDNKAAAAYNKALSDLALQYDAANAGAQDCRRTDITVNKCRVNNAKKTVRPRHQRQKRKDQRGRVQLPKHHRQQKTAVRYHSQQADRLDSSQHQKPSPQR